MTFSNMTKPKTEQKKSLEFINKSRLFDSFALGISIIQMPGERIELSRAEARGILSPLRLPISPPRLF